MAIRYISMCCHCSYFAIIQICTIQRKREKRSYEQMFTIEIRELYVLCYVMGLRFDVPWCRNPPLNCLIVANGNFWPTRDQTRNSVMQTSKQIGLGSFKLFVCKAAAPIRKIA